MEFKVDEASYQYLKPSKSTRRAQYPSGLRQDSNLTIPILPAELVTEILSRLPVKPLLRFTRVSKSWLALISGDKFIKAHLNLSANNKDYIDRKVIMSSYPQNIYNLKECTLRSLFYDSVTKAFDLDCPIKSYERSLSFVGSVNGLICLRIQNNDYFIWNPSIRKYKKLPNPRPAKLVAYPRVYGFGYDELDDDYKVVVRFYQYPKNTGFEVIYSLKSNSWRSGDNGGCVRANGRGMFVNGKLHWTTDADFYNRNSKNIISFDLADEKWEMVEGPCYGEGTDFLEVGVLNSDLSVIEYRRPNIDLWVMTEYGVKESWMKILSIEYHNNDFLNPPFLMSNKGEILVMLGSTFKIYKDGLFKNPKFINFNGYCKAEIYLESLVCPFSTRGN
ncbi:f-boxkelch-repeat protein [Nicotiana attenuata]|uniref:F-boxkelch-repeat protein n=2 Tax=Nicotiana attenuata TaxID=49451 RepID=A0A314L7P4_NICAT|nr:f-boxkelch-repeat protein [Nicotiana attenuata]